MIYPLPALLVSCGATPDEYNIFTAAWAGTICSDPAMCYVSIRPERHSHDIVERNMAFTLNLTNRDLARATDWCGVRSGRDCDKMALTGLTPVASETVKPPTFKEANLVLECRTLYRQPMTEASFIDRAPFEKWYSSAADLHIVYIAEVLAVRQAK